MTNQNVAVFSTEQLGPFLYADVTVERSGMELTLLSTLARQGLDPWKEAERLASLPRTEALAELSARLGRIGRSSEASRLVSLLPNAAAPARKASQTAKPPATGWLMAAMVAGMLSGFFFTPQKPADTVAPASWFSEPVPAKDSGHAKTTPMKEASKEPAGAPHPENG